jgi:type IV pilus assembly protein PilY1
MSSPFPTDINGDGAAEFIYVGDLKGNLWKFDISSSDHNNWGFAFSGNAPLFTAKDSADNPQPITSRPDATKHCSGVGQIVIFGTGQYLSSADIDDSSQQSLYGIWDYSEKRDPTYGLADDEYWITHNLLEQTAASTSLSGKTVRVMSDNEADWTTTEDLIDPSTQVDADKDAAHSGWYFDLPISKERITYDVAILGDNLFFVSNIPSEGGGICSAGGGGYSFIQAIDPCNGGRLDNDVFDVNGDHVYDSSDRVAVEIEDPENPGETITIEVPNSGIEKPGNIPGLTFLINTSDDKLYTITPTEPLDVGGEEADEAGDAPDTGMTFWIQRLE